MYSRVTSGMSPLEVLGLNDSKMGTGSRHFGTTAGEGTLAR
jgi:hypothetical protein